MKKNLLKKISLIVGIIILFTFIFMSILPSVFTSYERKEVFGANLEISKEHILGTNTLGYDLYTELVYGARETLWYSLLSALLSLFLSCFVGIGSAQKGALGSLLKVINDAFLMLPKMICFMVFAAALGSGKMSIVILCGLFSWAAGAKSLQSSASSLYEKPFIENLRLEGFGRARITMVHILPNLAPIIRARFILALNSCIMMQSTLAFLGLGDVYYPSWGTMVSLALDRGAILRGSYYEIIAPGLAIALLSFALYLINTYLESRRQY